MYTYGVRGKTLSGASNQAHRGNLCLFAINPGGKTTIGKRTLLVGDTGKV